MIIDRCFYGVYTTIFFLEFQLCEARPDLSGALFARRHDEQKSGNGGRKKAPN